MSTTPAERIAHPVAPFEVLGVQDTRDYEEQGDRMVPVPGSGDIVECARCDERIEIHATIRDADGDVYVVGTGCAAATGEARKLARRAATEARKMAEAERAAAARETVMDAAHYVSLQFFPVTRVEVTTGATGRKTWTVDGVSVSSPDRNAADDDPGRLACLQDRWAVEYLVDRLDVDHGAAGRLARLAGLTLDQAVRLARRGER